MKKELKIFTILSLISVVIPSGAFAEIPKSPVLHKWFTKNLCNNPNTSIIMSCERRYNNPFACAEGGYNTKFKPLYTNLNTILQQACKETNTTIFSHISEIYVKNNKIKANCEKGYKNPSGNDKYRDVRCVPKQDIDFIAENNAEQDKNILSKAAEEKRRAENEKYADALRDESAWETVEVSEAVAPISTDENFSLAATNNPELMAVPTVATSATQAGILSKPEQTVHDATSVEKNKKEQSNTASTNQKKQSNNKTASRSTEKIDSLTASKQGLDVTDGPTANTGGIKAKESAKKTSGKPINVSGNIKDETGEPLIGATVVAVAADGSRIDAKMGTTTDLDGNFTLKDVPSDAKIQVSYAGLKTQTIPADQKLDVQMVEDKQVLNEVTSAHTTETGDPCNIADENALKGKYQRFSDKEGDYACIPETCKDGYEIKDNACVLKAEEAKQEDKPTSTVPCKVKELEKINATKGNIVDKKCVPTECIDGYTLLNGSCIDEQAEQKYQDAKAKEQSLANRALTAATTAATGIGGMELAMGLSQQKADKEAEADMAAYIKTFRCSYGNGKSVKAGAEEIELPGGNDANLMKYRAEYVALAADLKARKEALGLKPGIEAEEILDKATMNLYDDENVGITSGNYESLYRAQALGSEEDQAKIDANKDAAKKRVIGGAVAAGVGVVGGVVGDSLINGKLGEKIRNKKQVSVLDKDKIVDTLTDEEIIKMFKDKGLTLESE